MPFARAGLVFTNIVQATGQTLETHSPHSASSSSPSPHPIPPTSYNFAPLTFPALLGTLWNEAGDGWGASGSHPQAHERWQQTQVLPLRPSQWFGPGGRDVLPNPHPERGRLHPTRSQGPADLPSWTSRCGRRPRSLRTRQAAGAGAVTSPSEMS